MTTVALIRQTYCNRNLGRADASTIPWTDADVDQHIVEVLRKLWPAIGRFTSGTVATNQNSDVYTVPAALSATDFRLSRIELEQTSGGVSGRVDKVRDWQTYSPTQVRIRPHIVTDSTLVLRFFGWIPYLADASDLPVRLEPAVGERAVGIAYGQLAGQLGNSQRQQGLDDGRVVDYQTAVGLGAYWERRYFDQIEGDPARLSYAPRRGRR